MKILICAGFLGKRFKKICLFFTFLSFLKLFCEKLQCFDGFLALMKMCESGFCGFLGWERGIFDFFGKFG